MRYNSFWEASLARSKAKLAEERRKRTGSDPKYGCGKCGHLQEKHKKLRSGMLHCKEPGCSCIHPAKWPALSRSHFAKSPFATFKSKVGR